MVPLSLGKTGEEYIIKNVGGRIDTKQHLEDMGFVVGGKVLVISETKGNLIVSIKDSRVAIDKSLANKIKV